MAVPLAHLLGWHLSSGKVKKHHFRVIFLMFFNSSGLNIFFAGLEGSLTRVMEAFVKTSKKNQHQPYPKSAMEKNSFLAIFDLTSVSPCFFTHFCEA